MKVGSLRAIAKSEGGMKKAGKISKTWARRKLRRKGPRATTKRKIQMFLNFN